MILLSAIVLIAGIAKMEIGERTLTVGVFSLLLLVVVVLYRRFRRSAVEVPWVFQAAAAIGVTLGVLTMISGVVHSAAVPAGTAANGSLAETPVALRAPSVSAAPRIPSKDSTCDIFIGLNLPALLTKFQGGQRLIYVGREGKAARLTRGRSPVR